MKKLFEPLESRILLDGTPNATVEAPAEAFIGEKVDVHVKFDNTNTGNNPGFGPYLDVVLPRGLTFNAVTDPGTFLGVPITTKEFTFPDAGGGTGQVAHPFAVDATGAPIMITGNAGEKLVVLQLPFGSFTTDQPPADIILSVTVDLLPPFTGDTGPGARVNVGQMITATGGFQFGRDALDNPATDPSTLDLTPHTDTIIPKVLEIIKTNSAPEGETATGPNFTRTYTLQVNVAAGQTVDNVLIQDLLPPNLQFVAGSASFVVNAGATAVGGSIIDTPVPGAAQFAPNNDLRISFTSLTGGAGNTGVTITYQAFVPRDTATPLSPVLDPVTGDDSNSLNQARVDYEYDHQALSTNLLANDTDDLDMEDQSIAIQKSVVNITDGVNSPGDVLEYTIQFQISDFFAFEDIEINDIFSDGQDWLAAFTPTLTVTDHGSTLATAAFSLANFTHTVPFVNGSTNFNEQLFFRVSDELITRAFTSGGSSTAGQLVGGGIAFGGTGGPLPDPNAPFGATVGTIVFRTVIQEVFDGDHPSGDPSVDQGDVLTNSAVIDGAVLDVTNLTPNGQREDDDTGTTISIPEGTVSKTIFAINGAAPAPGTPLVRPGDTITYRLTYTIPSGDIEDLVIDDYLPLPVFAAGELVINQFALGASGTPPPAGAFGYGPTHTFDQVAQNEGGATVVDPTVTIDAVQNMIRFSYPDEDETASGPRVVDILFTVTVRNDPFADGLFLTNQVHQENQSTNAGNHITDAIIQIQLGEPVLSITKGVVSTDAPAGEFNFSPGAVGPVTFSAPGSAGFRGSGTISSANLGTTPINSNLTGPDAGDLVTFAIVVENTGSSTRGAFDIQLADTLPAGFIIPPAGAGLNLRVTNGAGTVLGFVNVGGGTGLFDQGIEIVDAGAPGLGALADPTAAAGTNILIITYDLEFAGSIEPLQTVVNTATLLRFAGEEGGQNHIVTPKTDTASVQAPPVEIQKDFTATNQAHTAGANVVIGEIVTYTTTLTIPEGTTSLSQLIDTLDAGLAFVDLVSITSSTGLLTTSIGGGFGGVQAAAVFSNFGGGAANDARRMTLDFGTLTNADRDDAVDETITIVYRAVVLNVLGNQSGTNLNNSAQFVWAGGNVTDGANNVTVVEPAFTVTKNVSPGGPVDAGDDLTYTITVTNTGTVDAFDVDMTDVLPAGLVYTAGSFAHTGGVAPTTLSDATDLNAVWATLLVGQSSTLQFVAKAGNGVAPGEVVNNIANLKWTSLATASNVTQSTLNTLSVERTGNAADVGGAVNDYTATGPRSISINPVVPLKTIEATSEAATAGANVAIGEIVRYRIEVLVPEGQSTAFQIRDNLPPGLQFLDDGTAMIAFVFDSGGITSSTLSGGTLNQTGDETSVGTIDPSFVVPGAAITGGPFGSGTDVTFNFGNLDNQDRDADSEFVVLEFNAIVLNIAGNQNATILPNTASVIINGGPPTNSNSADVTVVEPDINNVVKRVINTDGTTATYEVTFTNTGTATAFNTRVLDNVPAILNLNVGSISITLGGGSAGATNNSTATSVDFDIATIPVGGTVRITYSALLTDTTQTVTNTATVTYTSLTGTNGTGLLGSTTGGPGTGTGERDGSGGVNDYTDVDTAGLGKIGDRLWFDRDNDGVQDAGEPGLVGVSVDVVWFGLDNAAGGGDDVTINTVTGANGFYNVGALPAGNYRVNVNSGTLPNGITTPTFDLDGTGTAHTSLRTLGEAEAAVNVDFGYRGTGSIGDTVWFDQDADGVKDANEPGLSGVSVTVLWAGQNDTFGDGDDLSVTTTTNAAGVYSVGNLASGNYRVSVNNGTLPNGITTATFDLDGTGTADTADTTLAIGQNRTDVDFGYRGTGSIGDFVWYDADADGVQDAGEPGLSNVTVTVIWFGQNGVLGGGDDGTFTTTTDALGGYSVGNLGSGNYRVDVTNGTLPNGITTATFDLDGAGTANTTATTLAIGQNRTNVDFGYRGTGSIGDLVWFDQDGNGVKAAGEPGLSGVQVTVTWFGQDGVGGNGDDVVFVRTTNASGIYGVSNLPSGNYSVAVTNGTLPNGLIDPTFDLDGTASPDLAATTLAIGQNRTDVDFGYRGAGAIGDRVWFDVDADGTEDAGEPGIVGATVTVRWSGQNGVFNDADDGIFTTTTGANGIYGVSNLGSGNHRVTVSAIPNGITAPTFDLDGTGTANTADAALAIAQVRADVDFGYTGTGSIGDTVWFDQDADGVKDAGEPGLSGVDVTVLWAGQNNVFGDGDDVTYQDTTDINGVYGIANLASGNYRVTVDNADLPNGIDTPTFDLDGVGTAHQATTTLAIGQNRTDADFGYRGTGSLGDRVWYDHDGDGVQDAGEPGINGVQITLAWAGQDGVFGNGDDGSFVTTTGGNGDYLFGNLGSGNYRATVNAGTLPNGLTSQTFDLDGTGTANTADTTLLVAENRTDVDFGYRAAGSIGDRVWFDRDADGVQDAGEPGLENVTVTVRWGGQNGAFGDADDLVVTTTTGANGIYGVANLASGNYRVNVTNGTLPNDVNVATFDLDGTGTANQATTTLAIAQNRTDVDFGYRGTASLGDRVWHDQDNDGVQDAGEAGLAGVTINVTWAGQNAIFGDADDGTFTATTGANGIYTLNNLATGDYRIDLVAASLPNDLTIQTFDLDGTGSANTADASLTTGQTRTDVDFGYLGTGSIGDLVWFDVDADGTQDAGEPGLAGVTVTVTWGGVDGVLGNADDGTYVTTTAADGSYLVGNLGSGNYRVNVTPGTLPNGINVPVFDLDGVGSAHQATTTLAAAQNRTDVDFGYRGAASLGDTVWFDQDNDGVKDAGEPGLSGVDLTVVWLGFDGALGGGDDVSYLTTTGANGIYTVSNLASGNYTATVATGTLPNGLVNPTFDLDGTGTPDTAATSLAIGQNRTDVDFGYRGAGALGDRVWFDVNADGVQDAGEPGIVGATVTVVWAGQDNILGNADDGTFVTTTGANGIYNVTDLASGDYRVTVSGQPNGFTAPTFDLDGTGTANTALASLAVAQVRTDVDFGYRGTGSIGDTVWYDQDADGVKDAGEPGIQGIDVTVLWAGQNDTFGDADDVSYLRTTDVNGVYQVTDLPSGNYRVTVDNGDLPNGITFQTFDLDGVGTAHQATTTLAVGQNRTDADFGYRGNGSLGDRVWFDQNGDGVQDANEPGLAGVQVTLSWAGQNGTFGDADDGTFITTTTGANGDYLFANLASGNYRATVNPGTLPNGATIQTFDLDGLGSANQADTTLAVGQNRTDVDFGYRGAGSIGDRVWFDQDADGVQDAGEPGLSGVTVTVTWAGVDNVLGNADDGTFVTITGANGVYGVANLGSGNYRVDVTNGTLPNGITTATFDLDGIGTANSTLTTLAVGQNRTDVDFGYRGAGSLGDRVWFDQDSDATQDAGEPGIVGVTVTVTWAGQDGLLGNADDGTFVTVTGANGIYTVNGLGAGDYRIVVDNLTLPDPSLAPTFDLDGTGTPHTADAALAAGQNRTDVDFGYFGGGSIGDRVWHDQDADGVQDANEIGLSGVTVDVQWAGNDNTFGNGDDGFFSTTTGADGIYVVANLDAGLYRVSVNTGTLPNGITTQTFDLDGTGSANLVDTTLALGQFRTNVDFGYRGVASIGDRVWFDQDADGVQDAGEPGLAGVGVSVLWAGQNGTFGDADDATFTTTTTGANGDYTVGNLGSGNYRVTVNAGTLPNDATVQTFDLDGTASANQADTTLAIAQVRTDVDFGYNGTASIGDFLWFDQNADGVQDANEPGLAGVGVTVRWAGVDGVLGNADDGVFNTTTNATGFYTVGNLTSGSYRVTVNNGTLPNGITTPTFDLDGTGSAHQADTTLTTGQNRTDVDFGYRGVASLGDRVWLDQDADGVQDAGEPGLAGVDVTLEWAGQDGTFGTADDGTFLTTTTGANGDYGFANLASGNYRVTVNPATLPNDANTPTFDLDGTGSAHVANAALAIGQVRTDVDFGYRGTGSIGDRVWYDQNADGVQDAGEPGLSGVSVTVRWAGVDGVLGNADDGVFLTTTGANGIYGVANLASGSYRVTVNNGTLPNGITFATFDLDGVGTADQADTTLAAGQNRTDVDFGYRAAGSIGDTVWFDQDNDGVKDANEPGLAGVGVLVEWAGQDGAFGTGDEGTFSTSTAGANGLYSVGNLASGNYRVSVNTGTLPNDVNVPTFDLDGIGTADTASTTLAIAQARTDVDFGYRGTGGIGDRLWLDQDNDGVQDANEPGLSGVDVTVVWAGVDNTLGTGDDGTFLTTTGANGLYSVGNLGSGNYRVTVDNADLPNGITTPTFDLDGVGSAHQADTTLAAAQVRTDVDFGYRGTAQLGDRVWFDQNADGVQDAGEPGLSGVAVDVLWAGQNGTFGDADDATFSTVTGANGVYGVANLGSGDYRITVNNGTLPNGLTLPTFDLDGIATADTADATLAIAQVRTDVDFGYRGNASLGDRVWFDQDADGVQDANEPGLAGVSVTLTWGGQDGILGNADDGSFVTTTTGANGDYLFANLASGNYRVTVNNATLPNAVNVPTFDLDGIVSAHSADTTLAIAQNRTDVDFGYRGTGGIGDRVWFDQNNDGVQDAGEPGLSGVSVTVVWAGVDGVLGNADDGTFVTTTGANGIYGVANLGSGDYRVDVNNATLPNGITTPTFDSDGTGTADTALTTLAAGQNRVDQDFGYRGVASLGDRVWFDQNADGVQDANEPGLAGAIVNLTWAGQDGILGNADDGTFSTTTTGANGDYLFANLASGNYRVSVVNASLPNAANVPTFDLDGVGSPDTADTTLAIAQARTDADFGYRGTGSIGDRLWLDQDADGVQDANEPGLAGVLVNVLWGGVDGIFGNADDALITTTTGANGLYSVTNLVSGNYRVSVDNTTLPSGITTPTFDLDGAGTADTADTTLAAGQNRTDVDFGYRGTGALGDRVWFDQNGDGVQDAGEPGLSGVVIDVLWAGQNGTFGDADDATFTTTTTGANGDYSVTNLGSGNYRVTVNVGTLPNGITTATFDFDGTGTANTSDTTLAVAQVRTDQDFGYQGTGSIGDRLWFDQNADGVQDANEPGLSGVTVTLVWAGVDGVVGNADDGTFVTTTGANGLYNFANLGGGNYRVTVDDTTLPNGLATPTFDLDGTGTAHRADAALAVGQARADVDFGYRGVGSIGDRVWFDQNADGVQDAGEPGLSGVNVTVVWAGQDGVLGNADDGTFNTVTGANGVYGVGNLGSGNYRVTVDNASLPNGVNVPTADLDGIGTADQADTTLAIAQVRTDADFGYRGTGAIGDRLWYDQNGDGVQDANEPGLSGVNVTVVWAGQDNILGNADDGTFNTVTGADGIYNVGNLAAGSYRVSVDGASLPPGVTDPTFDLDGTGTPDTTDLALLQGQTRTDADFGYRGTGAVGDLVWFDVDRDGVQDAGEPGIAGTTVSLIWAGQDGDLTTAADNLTLTTTTDAAGRYRFDFLPAGQYRVTVDDTTLPNGLDQPAFDLDGTATAHRADFALAPSQTRLDVDFGYVGPFSLGDQVWFDLNEDGVFQAGEPPIAGAQITVTWAGVDGDLNTLGDNAVFSATTDAAGRYRFDNLPGGAYRVSVDQASLNGISVPTYDLDDGTAPIDTPNVTNVNLVATNLDVDFGYVATGSIGDLVWYDADADGSRDSGEPGISGVRVNLRAAGIDGLLDTADDLFKTTVTDAQGAYLFDLLAPGLYRVTVDAATLPSGMRAGTFELDGTLDGQTQVRLGTRESNFQVDFGYTGQRQFGDRVFRDLDRDGLEDPGEPGRPGVTVTAQYAGQDGVFGTGDDVTLTTVTDANGVYRLNVADGNFRVFVDASQLPGLQPSQEKDDGVNAIAGVSEVTVAGADRFDVDFGFFDFVGFRPPQTTDAGASGALTEQLPGIRDLQFTPPLPPGSFPMIFSGSTEPGALLEFALKDSKGNSIFTDTVMSDAGGNWFLSYGGNSIMEFSNNFRTAMRGIFVDRRGMFGTLMTVGDPMSDTPHDIQIKQVDTEIFAARPAGFNLRTYFASAYTSGQFVQPAGAGYRFIRSGLVSVRSLQANNRNPFSVGLPGGESVSASTLPSGR